MAGEKELLLEYVTHKPKGTKLTLCGLVDDKELRRFVGVQMARSTICETFVGNKANCVKVEPLWRNVIYTISDRNCDQCMYSHPRVSYQTKCPNAWQ